jgi:dephospho-CoA kinase
MKAATEPVVLGFSGKMASGKTTLSRIFAEAAGWEFVSFGDHVREVARQQNLDVSSRDVLQKVGASLIAEDPEGFCRAVLEQAKHWKPGQPLVVDGIRHVQVESILQKLVAPSKFILIYIFVEDPIIQKRLREEGISDLEQIKRLEAHPTEAQVESLLPEAANYIFDGTEPPGALVDKLEEIVSGKVNWNENDTIDINLLGRGQYIYNKTLKGVLEPQHNGQFVAIETQSGRYFLGNTRTEVLMTAHAQMPDARFFLTRIGPKRSHAIESYA